MQKLIEAEVEPDDVQRLVDHIKATSPSPEKAPAYAAGILQQSVEELRATMLDFRAFIAERDAKAEQAAAEKHRQHPGEHDRKRSAAALAEERKLWAEQDREHYVRCRERDGYSREQALAEFEPAAVSS